jgi:hypothetical protein
MTPLLIPGQNPGEFFMPSAGRTVRLVEWREDDFYDTVQLPGVTPTAGLALEFFRDIAGKSRLHTNFATPRKIPAGQEFILVRVGVQMHQAYGNTLMTDDDTIKFVYNAYLRFALGDRIITEGPVVKYQSGMGVQGSTTRVGTGIATNGVPSAAAAPNLLVAQTIKEEHDLNGSIQFLDNGWLGGGIQPTFTARPVVTLFLHGLIKKPQGG